MLWIAGNCHCHCDQEPSPVWRAPVYYCLPLCLAPQSVFRACGAVLCMCLCCFVACNLLMESAFVAKYVPLPEVMSVIAQGLQRNNPSSVQCALKVLEAINSFVRLSLLHCIAYLTSSCSSSLVSKIRRSSAHTC